MHHHKFHFFFFCCILFFFVFVRKEKEMNILQPSDQKSTNPNVDAKINDDIKAGKFRIQIASDLHLEHLSDPKMMMELIKPTAPYLALVREHKRMNNWRQRLTCFLVAVR